MASRRLAPAGATVWRRSRGPRHGQLIPDASFTKLPGTTHALLALAGTRAFERFLEEAPNFVATRASLEGHRVESHDS
jgi:hypothetical protein